MSSLDYLDLCRLCLVKDRVSVPIFEDEGDVRQIFLKITACLPVKVSREDKLPKKICDDCVYKVELFYQFWNTTANAEKQLLQWLGEVGGLEDNQSYVTEVLNSNVMKQERSSDSRLDGSVMQVGGHQNNMDIGMIDNMSLITMPTGNEQFTSVPMDTANAVQTVQAVAGSSTQTSHDQITQNQTAVTHLVEEEEESEDEENSDDGCDNEEGLPVKEETEEDPSEQPLEPTTFVNVSIPCDEAGPSGLQQQKISEISELTLPQTADGDSKTGTQTFCLQRPHNQFIFIRIKNEFETQQQILIPQQQQQLLVLPQSQQQQQQQQQPLLLLQQSQQQPLLVLQQQIEKLEKAKEPLLVLQKPQEHQQKLILQSSDKLKNQQQLEQQQIINLDNPPDPLKLSVPLLPVIESQRKIQNVKLNILKSPRTSKYPKRLKFKIPVIKELEVKQEQLKMEVSLSHQEYIPTQGGSSTIQNFTPTQELPSTSREIFPEICNSRNSDDGNEDFEDNDSKEHVTDEMKEIYTRIDYGGYQCNICQLTRLDRRSMLFHISGQHSHLRPFKCDSCDKTFKRKYSLKVHQLSHNLTNAIETYPCEKCNYRTPNKVSLRYHYYRVHTNEYRFTCEHCGKRFKVKRELADHLVTHSGIQHMCDICGKLYRGEHLLRAHRRLHLDLYKFQCVMCKKKLATEEGLTNHMKLHSRTYKCDECGMKFPSKYNLIKHRNVHTREQAFPCPECGKVFADQPTQKVHSLIHAGLKPYRCNVCGLGFTQRTPMMLHWKKKHPGETDPPPPVILKNILKSIEEKNDKNVQKKNK